jgi:hypothetical protein
MAAQRLPLMLVGLDMVSVRTHMPVRGGLGFLPMPSTALLPALRTCLCEAACLRTLTGGQRMTLRARAKMQAAAGGALSASYVWLPSLEQAKELQPQLDERQKQLDDLRDARLRGCLTETEYKAQSKCLCPALCTLLGMPSCQADRLVCSCPSAWAPPLDPWRRRAVRSRGRDVLGHRQHSPTMTSARTARAAPPALVVTVTGLAKGDTREDCKHARTRMHAHIKRGYRSTCARMYGRTDAHTHTHTHTHACLCIKRSLSRQTRARACCHHCLPRSIIPSCAPASGLIYSSPPPRMPLLAPRPSCWPAIFWALSSWPTPSAFPPSPPFPAESSVPTHSCPFLQGAPSSLLCPRPRSPPSHRVARRPTCALPHQAFALRPQRAATQHGNEEAKGAGE